MIRLLLKTLILSNLQKSLTFYHICEGKKVILARQKNKHYRKGLKLSCVLRFEQDIRRKSLPIYELSTNLFSQK